METYMYRVGVVIELVILSILGVVGNVLVIAVYVRQKHLHSAVIFILTLAVTDFITCLVTIPFTIATEIVSFQLRYDFICKLYYFLLTSTVPFSAFMMTAIAVDRFLCIVGPFRYRFSVLCARILAVCLAVFAATSGILTSLMYGVQSEKHVFYFDGQCLGVNDHLPHEAAKIWQKVYSSFYLICGVVVIILYGLIYVYVITNHNVQALIGRYPSRPERNQTELTPMNQSDLNTAEGAPVLGVDCRSPNAENTDGVGTTSNAPVNVHLSARKHIQFGFMLSVVAFVYLLCFLPAWLMSHGLIEFNAFVFYFYFSYHVTNPAIYSLISKSFRKKLVRQLCGRCRGGDRRNETNTNMSQSTSAN